MTKRRLGGWWRLWILVSLVYGIVIGGLTNSTWPSSGTPPTLKEFRKQLSSESLKVVERWKVKKGDMTDEEAIRIMNGTDPGPTSPAAPPASGSNPRADSKKGDWIDALPAAPSATAHKPNPFDQFDTPPDPSKVQWDDQPLERANLPGWLPPDATKDEKNRLYAEYDAMVETNLSEMRWRAIRSAITLWITPCLAVLLAGLGIGWVCRGFRTQRT